MKVEVRNPLHGLRLPFMPKYHTYEGELVATPKWIDYDAIALTTNDPKFRVRVIAKSDIISVDGSESKYIAPISSERVLTVAGSKGNVYTVTIGTKTNSCTCVAFQYRRSCKHINEALAQ